MSKSLPFFADVSRSGFYLFTALLNVKILAMKAQRAGTLEHSYSQIQTVVLPAVFDICSFCVFVIIFLFDDCANNLSVVLNIS